MGKTGRQCRAAIIGLGRIASLLEEDSRREKPCTHAGAITANPDCILTGGFDIDPCRSGLFSKRWGVPVYQSAEELIRVQKPGILTIATDPVSHYYYCRLASALAVPVIVCEKPLSDNLSRARKIVKLAKQNNTTIITNHERRYSADYKRAKDILARGKLGRLLSVRAVLCMGKNRRLLDVLWHDGTHLVDALMFLTGSGLKHRRRFGAKLSSASGTAWLEGELRPNKITRRNKTGESGVPAETVAGRDHDDPLPVPVIIEIGAGRDHLIFEMEFSCEAGRLRIGNGIFEVWESGESPYAEKFRSLEKTDETFEGATGYFANMVSDAVACFTERGRVPVSSAADGLAVIEYLESVGAWR